MRVIKGCVCVYIHSYTRTHMLVWSTFCSLSAATPQQLNWKRHENLIIGHLLSFQTKMTINDSNSFHMHSLSQPRKEMQFGHPNQDSSTAMIHEGKCNDQTRKKIRIEESNAGRSRTTAQDDEDSVGYWTGRLASEGFICRKHSAIFIKEVLNDVGK